MFQNGDDEEGGIPLKVDEFYGIGIPVFLKEGEKPLADILNVLGFDVFKDIDVDKIPDKIREKVTVKRITSTAE